MSRNKGISTIRVIKCRTVEIPFFVILETNQLPCSVRVEDTDLLSVGREYRTAKQNYDALADEINELRAEKEELLLQEANKDGIRQRMANMVAFLQSEPEEVTEYSESLVRRMIEKITVYDDHFVVEFKSGIEITINE